MEYEDDYDPTEEDEDFPVGGLGVFQDAFNRQRQKIKARFAAGEDYLRQRMTGGDENMRRERLLMLAAALGQPTRTGSFGETLGNFSGALAGSMKSQRERKEALEDALYKQQMAKDALTAQLEAKYITAAKPREPKTTWSENLRQFVTEGQPYTTGRRIVTDSGIVAEVLSDNTLRVKNNDGSQSIYTPAGQKIKDIPVGGN